MYIKRIIISKLKPRLQPRYESPFVDFIYSFGQEVIGQDIIYNEGDFNYLKVLLDNNYVYLPTQYITDLSNKIPNPFELSNENPLPLEYIPNNLIEIPLEWVVSHEKIKVTQETFIDLYKLFEQAEIDKVSLKVTRGYLDINELSNTYYDLFEDFVMQVTLEKPSCSPYHFGSVIDFTSDEIDYFSHPIFQQTKSYQWLLRFSYQFNFINLNSLNQFIRGKSLYYPFQFIHYNNHTKRISEFSLKNTYTLSFKSFNNIILFLKYQYKKKNLKYLFIHDNEHTARKTSRYALKKYGGTLFEILNNNQRYITQKIDGYYISYDPNRIFTDKGLWDNLVYVNPDVPENTLKKLMKMARTNRNNFLKMLLRNRKDFIISIHTNNRTTSLSIHYFLLDENKKSFQVHVNQNQHPKNFIYTINYFDYIYFTKLGYNVVLQKESDICDDGSLSIYMARKKMKYITIEVLEGFFTEQRKMLNDVVKYTRCKTFFLFKYFNSLNNISYGI